MKRLIARFSVLAFALVLAPPAEAQRGGPPLGEGQGRPPRGAPQRNQSDNRERYRVEPQRVEKGPLVDGVLDETVWQHATVIDTFTQQEPAEGQPATERTEVLLLYDATHLYIGVRAHDSSPNGIVATEMRRDSERLLEEDNFQVILDTFNDSRSGYMFVTNPLGAKLEQQVFEEGEGSGRPGAPSNINRNWDGVWDVRTQRTAEGWTAEIALPVVTIRFPQVGQQAWGVNFMRNIRRKNEQVYWAPIPRVYGLTRVSLSGSMTGMTALDRGLDLRIKPFVVGGGRRDRTGSRITQSRLNDLGLDVKYGVGSGLNLDVTLNTDFAQAEVDEQQVNLTRFPLFFPEKRDFFLENAGLFAVRNAGSERLADLFFTRRIGLSEEGQPIPIAGGARLTGKVDRHNLAILNIQTEEAFGQSGENFLVARYSRDVLGRSKIGGLVVNKEATGNSSFNRTFATDTTLALTRSFTINSFLAKTSTPGLSGGDMALYGRAGWLDSRWDIYGEYADVQDNFNPEVGFVPRRGIRVTTLHLERTPRPRKYHIRVMNPMFNLEYTTDQHNRLVTRRLHYMVLTRFDDGTFVNVVYNRHFEWLDVPFRIQRNVTIPVGAYRFGEWNLTYNSNPARRIYHRITYSPQTFFGGTRTDMSGAFGVRATNRLAAELRYQRNDVDLPWGAFDVNLSILRLDLALSPRMTFRTLSQYNSLTRQLSNSVRFNVIYRPGSDFYVTYDELKSDLPGLPEIRNRQLLVKFTYLLVR